MMADLPKIANFAKNDKIWSDDIFVLKTDVFYKHNQNHNQDNVFYDQSNRYLK